MPLAQPFLWNSGWTEHINQPLDVIMYIPNTKMSKTEFSLFPFKTCSFFYNESGKHFYSTFYMLGMILSTLYLFTHLIFTTILR